jgi:hypothetical protein
MMLKKQSLFLKEREVNKKETIASRLKRNPTFTEESCFHGNDP